MSYQLPKIVKRKKRVGRGIGSRGAKSTRGQKGQRSRAGSRQKAGFEGGQTPLYMRLPKERGTKQRFSSRVKKAVAVSVKQLGMFEEGAVVGPGQFRKAGFLPRGPQRVKIVGGGEVDKKLTVRAHRVTDKAREIIEKAGGKVEVISGS